MLTPVFPHGRLPAPGELVESCIHIYLQSPLPQALLGMQPMPYVSNAHVFTNKLDNDMNNLRTMLDTKPDGFNEEARSAFPATWLCLAPPNPHTL